MRSHGDQSLPRVRRMRKGHTFPIWASVCEIQFNCGVLVPLPAC